MKSFKYIIKRILIGTGIALLLGLIRGTLFANVYAKEMSSLWLPYNNNVAVVTNLDETVTFDTDSGKWANWGYGILRFNFTVIKVSGSATAPLVVPNNVTVNNYVCDIDTTSFGNSTFTGSTYSVSCPVIMGSSGLGRLYMGFTGNQQNEQSTYRITLGGMFTFEQIDTSTYDPSSTNSAINNQTTNITNNQNSNTQSIISNNNTNTQSIINNQNNNTQQEIESQKVCIDYGINYGIFNGNLTASGTVGPGNFKTSDFISISSSSTITVLESRSTNPRICFYNSDKGLISCSSASSVNEVISIPNNTFYFRYTVDPTSLKPIYHICKNGNQALADSQQEINNTLNNDDVTGASGTAESFFDDFQSDAHGLSGIITAPLRLIQSLSTSSCSSLTIPLPFVNTNASLPCMSTIYSTYFPTFLSLYQLITTGLIGYWVLIKIFGHVKGMQDPKDDRIEVLDL